jgi:hypothetical protein
MHSSMCCFPSPLAGEGGESRATRATSRVRGLFEDALRANPSPALTSFGRPLPQGEREKRHEINRSRGASLRPSYATPRSRKRVGGSEIRGRRCRFDLAPGFRYAPPGLRNKGKKIRRRNADRRKASSAVPYGHGRTSNVRRTSIGVPPRLSSQGVFHRKGLSTRLLLPGTWRPGLACPSSGRYPPLPVPVQRPNAPRS